MLQNLVLLFTASVVSATQLFEQPSLALQMNQANLVNSTSYGANTSTLTNLSGVGEVERQLEHFIDKYDKIAAVVLIVFGCWVAFKGGQVVDTLLKVVISIAAGFLTAIICFFILDKADVDQSDLVFFIVIAISIVVGVLTGRRFYDNSNFKRVGMLTLAVFVGIMVGFTISNTIKNKDKVILYVILGICAAAGWWLMERHGDDFIVVSTAFIGAYCIVRGASIFIGDFPSEVDVSESEHSNAFYAYLASILILWVVAAKYQWKHGSGGGSVLEGGYQMV